MEPNMKILVAGWDSGGGVEAVQTVVRRAVRRGHQVRVLGTEGLRSRFESAGADFSRYRYAPDNDTRQRETDLLKEWEVRTPIGMFVRVRDRLMFGPARLFCRDLTEELDREPADVVVVDTMVPSALVLVSLSSTVMDQEGLLQRTTDALGQLPVHALVTTGPAVDPAVIRSPQNVSVRRWARHADVLPYCSAVVTHGGHGTVLKALTAGVPLVIAPLGRDQPDNAARVIRAGAGLRVRRTTDITTLQRTIGQVLDDHRYRDAARHMTENLVAERDDELVVDELERAAAEPRVSGFIPRGPLNVQGNAN